MKVAVVGGSISGLVSAHVLSKAGVNVVLYEENDYFGSHVNSFTIDGLEVDLSFITFNPVNNANTIELFESMGIDLEATDVSFSMSLQTSPGFEWGTRNGVSSMFAQKKNFLNPYFWLLLREITTFKNDVTRFLERFGSDGDLVGDESLGDFISSHGYSELFQQAYLVPICASIWPGCLERLMSFSAYSVLSFFHDHQLFQLFERSQWLITRKHSLHYISKVTQELERRGCQIKSGCKVRSVSTVDEGCFVFCEDGSEERYDECIMAVHGPRALEMLGEHATYDERRILGAFQYVCSDTFLHRDHSLMPQNLSAWSVSNFIGAPDSKSCLTYCLNLLQNIDEKEPPYFVTVNPPYMPKGTMLKWSTCYSVPLLAASKAAVQLDHIQGKRGVWFCEAFQGYGFHEGGVKAGMATAYGILKESFSFDNLSKQMVPSLTQRGARLLVTRFLADYIAIGTLILLEEGGSVLTFQGTRKRSPLKVYLKVHNPHFYWKIAREADLGLADAYINGDFSLVDEKEGLFSLFMIFIANAELKASDSRISKRGWWTPLLSTALLGSAKYCIKHALRKNTLAQARKNISLHYDLSNELFALFLDETMQYSCAVFKSEDEDLKDAQMRKISALIEKARIKKHHEVLEIGCGWGSLAIELVKRSGCKYTGITLSTEQLKYAEMKVKEAGLQDQIRFLLCDYRQLPTTHKYDRIISCEMIESIGHQYMDEYFRCCESALAEDGLFVLQFISVADERYEEFRQSAGFMKEYIFQGGFLPSFSKITSAMAASSRLCVEHVETIGIHYYQTLRYWRRNFLENRSKILALGFDEKFIRTWEYYFDYCAAGFKSRLIGDYQVVFSRLGNNTAFDDPYAGFPSAYPSSLSPNNQS